jgi:hypothetical protein
LSACIQVNNGQAPMPKPNRAGYVPPLAIRTAMRDRVHHPLDEVGINWLSAIKI